MSDKSILNEESSAVQCHLSILQGVVQRMADNSRSCKLWCITIVSAILVLVVKNDTPDLVRMAVIPTIIFLILDTYYLALERRFRCSYNGFIKKLHVGKGVDRAKPHALRPERCETLVVRASSCWLLMALRIKRLPKRLEPVAIPLESGDGDLLKEVCVF